MLLHISSIPSPKNRHGWTTPTHQCQMQRKSQIWYTHRQIYRGKEVKFQKRHCAMMNQKELGQQHYYYWSCINNDSMHRWKQTCLTWAHLAHAHGALMQRYDQTSNLEILSSRIPTKLWSYMNTGALRLSQANFIVAISQIHHIARHDVVDTNYYYLLSCM